SSASSASRRTEPNRAPPLSVVIRLAILRDAYGSSERATLRVRIAVCSAEFLRLCLAMSKPTVSDIYLSLPRPAFSQVALALHIEPHLEKFRAGLRHFGVRGVVTLRLDRRCQLGRMIDVRTLQRTGND